MTSATKAGPLSDPMEMGIPYLGIISFSKAHFLGLFCLGGEGLYPPRKGAHSHQKILVGSGSRQLSEVYFQVFKRGFIHRLDSQFREEPLFGVIFGTCFTLLTNTAG
jgi:hypothetical protein